MMLYKANLATYAREGDFPKFKKELEEHPDRIKKVEQKYPELNFLSLALRGSSDNIYFDERMDFVIKLLTDANTRKFLADYLYNTSKNKYSVLNVLVEQVIEASDKSNQEKLIEIFYHLLAAETWLRQQGQFSTEPFLLDRKSVTSGNPQGYYPFEYFHKEHEHLKKAFENIVERIKKDYPDFEYLRSKAKSENFSPSEPHEIQPKQTLRRRNRPLSKKNIAEKKRSISPQLPRQSKSKKTGSGLGQRIANMFPVFFSTSSKQVEQKGHSPETEPLIDSPKNI